MKNEAKYKKHASGENFELYLGDNKDVLPNLDLEDSVVITSPPYNFGRSYDKYEDNNAYQDFLNFLYDRFKVLYNSIPDDGRVIVVLKDNFSDFRFLTLDFYNVMNDIGFNMYGYYVVQSSHIAKYTAWGSWRSASAPRIRIAHEIVQVYYKKTYKRKRKGKSSLTKEEFMEYTLSFLPGGAWFSKEINKKEHPAQFSPALIDRFVKLFSFYGDIIVDPFCGVGNAGVSALRNGRKFIGIDISEKYLEIAYNKLIRIEKQEK